MLISMILSEYVRFKNKECVVRNFFIQLDYTGNVKGKYSRSINFRNFALDHQAQILEL